MVVADRASQVSDGEQERLSGDKLLRATYSIYQAFSRGGRMLIVVQIAEERRDTAGAFTN
jgi:hypothetical protein